MRRPSSIDWSEYGSFYRSHSSQQPMSDETATEVESIVAALLGLEETDASGVWGVASPPGRYAATVVHILPSINHAFKDQALALRTHDIGVKVFKTDPRTVPQAQQSVRFLQQDMHRLPGLPNPYVQKVLAAGLYRGRYYAVLAWASGRTLEDLHREQWVHVPPPGPEIQRIVRQILGDLIIPLWGAGTIFWDIRDANYCWNSNTNRLTLIDVDAIGAYADEILHTPGVWTRRERGQQTALPRLRNVILRLLLTRRRWHSKTQISYGLECEWKGLQPFMCQLGRDPDRREEVIAKARAALVSFIMGLQSRGIL